MPIARLGWVLALFCLCWGKVALAEPPAAAPLANAEAAAVEKVWLEYRGALIARDSARALPLLTRASVAEYERQRQLALKLTRHELLQADVLDRYMVLMLRARLSAAELRRASGTDLLRLAIDRGWIGSDLPEGIHVKRIAGGTAVVALVKNGAEAPGEVPIMRRTGARWQIDLVELTRIARPGLTALFSKLAELKHTDINGAIMLVLAQIVGTTPADTIWDPPQ